MWFIPVCAFPAFVHMLLIWTVGALCSKVSGSPSEVLVYTGRARERRIWRGFSFVQTSGTFCCAGEGGPLLSTYNVQFLFRAVRYIVKRPLSFRELTFCDFYRTAVCEM